MSTLAVINQKGGTGKSTSAENLGAALARRGRSVLIVDLDPQRSLTIALTDGADPWSVVSVEDGLDLMAGDPRLASADLRRLDAIERMIDADEYDVTILDCPPTLSALAMSAIHAADEVIVPTQASYLSVAGIPEILETVAAVNKRSDRPARGARVLITMYERNGATREMESQIRSSWPCFETVIRKNVAISYAQAAGVTVFGYDPRSSGARDYDKLAAEIIGSES